MKRKYSPRILGFTPVRSPTRMRMSTPRTTGLRVGTPRRLVNPYLQRRPAMIAPKVPRSPWVRRSPIKPWKRVLTRAPTSVTRGSPFKTYTSAHYLSFFSNAGTATDNVFFAGRSGTVPNNICAAYLAPTASASADAGRTIKGDKATFVCLNIFARFGQMKTLSGNIRMTIVECRDQEGWETNTVSGTAEYPVAKYLTTFFKATNFNDEPETFDAFTDATPLDSRWYRSINTNAFKVLAQKYITLNDKQKTWSTAHMFVKVNKALDKDKKIKLYEPWSNMNVLTGLCTPQQTVAERFSTVKPLLLLFEYTPMPDGKTGAENEEWVRGRVFIKYTMKDAL